MTRRCGPGRRSSFHPGPEVLRNAAPFPLSGDTPETQFLTNMRGTHQRLSNGNMRVNESARGRILEFTPSGALAFSYDNRVGAGRNGRTFAARRLPPNMDAAFFTD